MAGVFTYDPKAVIITIGGVPMSGFSDGTFVEIVRDEATWSKIVGADGFVTRGKTNNFSGTLTLTLKQSSPSNDVLSGFIISDELTNAVIIPILVKDLSGNSTYFAAQGWVQAYANSTFGKEINDREWTIALANLDLFVGSNAETN
jgi:secreted protein with Ig-like and vWFA domain